MTILRHNKLLSMGEQEKKFVFLSFLNSIRIRYITDIIGNETLHKVIPNHIITKTHNFFKLNAIQLSYIDQSLYDC